jgi:preprotein translocase subunit SecA
MAFSAEQRVQRERWFAVVDEVDSILIDEARTPLIISGPAEDSSELYIRINKMIPGLRRQPSLGLIEGKEAFGEGDYSVDEKSRQVFLSEEGHERVEELLHQEGLLAEGTSLYDSANIMLMHHVNAALRAHVLFTRDVEYIVRNGEIIIVDEFTGRTMPGRRWSEGLHQAVEAKEGVTIQHENQTLASITFQNYFRLYKKLSGMTGTADTEAYEFQQIYGLEVVVIPTNRPMARKDMGDLIYLTTKEKYKAIVEDVKERVKAGQPVLVGTASIEASELVSGLLEAEKIPHKVLNAKHHTQEAAIVAQAGRPGAVTIATNMAGRGTDIVLGGSLAAELAALGESATEAEREAVRTEWRERHELVRANGGLYVLGTERHESRRIDNQLRGRSGRQGDPGATRFYLSMEDNLMRIFASDRVAGLMQKLGMQEGEAIEHPWVTKSIENAQRKVEGRNFDIRKQLLEYDDVANDQRKVVYAQRNELMDVADVTEMVQAMMVDVVESLISRHIPAGSMEEQWNVAGLEAALAQEFNQPMPLGQWLEQEEGLHEELLRQRIHQSISESYTAKEQQVGTDGLRYFEKAIMLQILDHNWKEHLAAMDYLRQGIHLRGYAQKNPKQEYKREAFEMFSEMLDTIKHDVVTTLLRAEVRPPEEMMPQDMPVQEFEFRHEAFNGFGDTQSDGAAEAEEVQQPFKRAQPKVGRNDPCPCGSGKKYKQCCGKLQ